MTDMSKRDKIAQTAYKYKVAFPVTRELTPILMKHHEDHLDALVEFVGAIRADERQEIVKALETFLTELDQLPRIASIKFANTIVRQVAEKLFEITQLRSTP
jgi:hypothetical protein